MPINVREVRDTGVLLPRCDGTFPDPDTAPIYVPERTVITYFPLLTQHNPAMWGDDADIFDPERWLDERLSRFTDRPMIFSTLR